MNLESFTGPGSTPSRRRFWDKVTQAVIASQKVAGDNVTVDEHQGYGSLISINPQRQNTQGGGGTGACCYNDGTCDDLTEADCNDAGGNWQGSDTPCSEGLCVGVCCEGEGGTTCVDDSTPDSCATDGGTWQGFGTTCADDPPPCSLPICPCNFLAYDDSEHYYLTKTTILISTYSAPDVGTGFSHDSSANMTEVFSFDPGSCDSTCDRTGSCSSETVRTSDGCITIQCDSTGLFCGSPGGVNLHQITRIGGDCQIDSESDITFFDSSGGDHGEVDFGAGGCANLDGYPGTESFTQTQHIITGSGSFGSYSLIATLSDECTPEGGSVFDDPFFRNN